MCLCLCLPVCLRIVPVPVPRACAPCLCPVPVPRACVCAPCVPVVGVAGCGGRLPACATALPDADARLKGYLETAADCVYTLEHSPTALDDLRAVGTQKSVPVQTVLVLEAVIVLLSPKHAFSGPNPSVFGASWAASHRLLLLPPPELARRLREVGVRVCVCACWLAPALAARCKARLWE